MEQAIPTTLLIGVMIMLAGQGSLTGFAVLGLSGLTGRFCGLFQSAQYSLLIWLIIIVSIFGYILVSVVGGGFVYSAEYGTYLDAWNSDSVPVRRMIDNGSRNWKPMSWTILLNTLVTWGPVIITGVPWAFIILSSCTGPINILGLVSLLLPLEIAIFASLIISIFTVYTYPAVVIDHVSGWNAIKHSFNVASRNFGTTFTYLVVRGAFQLILLFILGQLGAELHAPLSSLLTIVITLLLVPILHSTKTMIYHYARMDTPDMEFSLTEPIIVDMYRWLPRLAWRKVKYGLRTIGGYLADIRNLPYHLASIGAFLLGVVLGNYATNNGLYAALSQLGLLHPGRGNPNVAFPNVLPPFLGVDLFFHNWLVSIGTALAGIGFIFPSFASILFNGFILGFLQPTIPSDALFLSAILPHGIIEIPSLILSGSAGIKLGVAAIRVKLRPTEDNRDSLAMSLRQSVYIVIGLALMFLIAGLIEADVTPLIMRLYGWTF